jgi:hypothetical protein
MELSILRLFSKLVLKHVISFMNRKPSCRKLKKNLNGKFNFIIKYVFLSSKNLYNYFLFNINHKGISNFIKKHQLQSEKMRKLHSLFEHIS